MSRNQHPFKQRDINRAARSAEKAGLEVGGIEVVTKDGVTIRILSKTAAGQGSDAAFENWIAKHNASQT